MKSRTEKQPSGLSRLCAIFASVTVAGLLLMAPMANANSNVSVEQTSKSSSTTALDTLATGSIGTTATHAKSALQGSNIDHAVASSMSSVQIPSYLTMLADRRILVLLSLIGLFVVWINRMPQNRDDSKN